VAFVVVYDACALYGNTARNLLIRVARVRLVQAKWTDRILDELDRALADKRGIPEDKRRRLRRLMNAAIADCLVTGYEPLIEGLKLPDPDDRHVLAAAIKVGAQAIVTANVADFPAEYLAQWESRRRVPMTSSSTFSASTTAQYTPVSSRLSTNGPIHPRHSIS